MDRRAILLSVPGFWLAGQARAAVTGSDWPNWRGPAFNGSSPEKGLPVKFSPSEGVKWTTELPGPSAATPVIIGDSVFVTAALREQQQLLALCVDRNTGKERWRQIAGTGYRPAGLGTAVQLDDRSNYASPSPVSDGKRVIFFFGNGDLVAYDLNGKLLWSRNLQKDYGDFCFGWTFSSSPQLYEGRLYFQLLQRDLAVSGRGRPGSKSYLFAFNPATGAEEWRVERPSPAKLESREAFTTPIPHEHKGRKELVLAGGDVLTGHDPATGKELWRWGTWNPGHVQGFWRLVPSPAVGGGVILACAPKREPVYAVKAGGNGELGADGLAWVSEQRGPVTSDVPTPLFYKDRFYILSDVRKTITCTEPATGKAIWSQPTPGPSMCWASPAGADGRVYVMSLTGDVHVYHADTGEILATNPMATDESEIRSSIAVAHASLFIRTNSRLYCIGKA